RAGADRPRARAHRPPWRDAERLALPGTARRAPAPGRRRAARVTPAAPSAASAPPVPWAALPHEAEKRGGERTRYAVRIGEKEARPRAAPRAVHHTRAKIICRSHFTISA